MSVLIKKFILLFLLLSFNCGLYSQLNKNHSLSLGFGLNSGNANTETATLIKQFDPLLVTNKIFNSWATSIYLEQRFSNSFAVQLGSSFINSTYSYWDQTTTNNGGFNAITEEYVVKSKMKYLKTNLGVSKIFFSNSTIRPFVGLHFNLSFIDGDSTDFKENTPKSTHQTLLGYHSSPVFGFTPEIGLKLGRVGHGNWIFSLKFHKSTADIMSGEYASYNTNFTDANYSSIKTSGNIVYMHLGYEFPLKKWEPKDKLDKQLEKEKEAQQKQLKAEQKSLEKKKLLAEKEANQKEKLHADSLLKHNKEDLKTDVNGTPKELLGRKIEIQKELEVFVSQVELQIWDDGAEIDGDSIKIFFNGEWIVTELGLTKEKQTITLNLNEKGKNYLIVYALNEGVHPPNTAAISFFNGNKEVKFSVHSKMNESGAISFKFKSP